MGSHEARISCGWPDQRKRGSDCRLNPSETSRWGNDIMKTGTFTKEIELVISELGQSFPRKHRRLVTVEFEYSIEPTGATIQHARRVLYPDHKYAADWILDMIDYWFHDFGQELRDEAVENARERGTA